MIKCINCGRLKLLGGLCDECVGQLTRDAVRDVKILLSNDHVITEEADLAIQEYTRKGLSRPAVVEAVMSSFASDIKRDGAVTPQELGEIRRFAELLRVPTAQLLDDLNMMALVTLFQSGDFPEARDGFPAPLTKTEVGHLVLQGVDLYEFKSRRVGLGASFRVARGLYLHGGQSESREHLAASDSGTVILTSQRLMFNGGRRSWTIKKTQLAGYELMEDALAVSKSSTAKNNQPMYLTCPKPMAQKVLNIAVMNWASRHEE